MRKKLTPKLIDNLPLPLGKQYEVGDELVTGLVVRVSATGGKVWYNCCKQVARSSVFCTSPPFGCLGRYFFLGSW
jgi:hypothetical protein